MRNPFDSDIKKEDIEAVDLILNLNPREMIVIAAFMDGLKKGMAIGKELAEKQSA